MIIEKIRNGLLMCLGAVFALAAGAFSIFVMGGLLALAMLAIPVGALAMLLLPKEPKQSLHSA